MDFVPFFIKTCYSKGIAVVAFVVFVVCSFQLTKCKHFANFACLNFQAAKRKIPQMGYL